jgi:hypothetical protein
MDETDRLAAATIVAAMITAGHPLVRTAVGLTDWGSIAKGWFECAQVEYTLAYQYSGPIFFL